MIKYILHGGATNMESIHNDNFFKEMLKGLPSLANILLIYFANDRKKWESLTNNDKENFAKANDGKELNFVVASNNIDELRQQIKSADLVYMRGGSLTDVLLVEMSRLDDLQELFDGKIVSGSSAGAYILSKYFYSQDMGGIFEGTGVLPIKCTAHYTEKKDPFIKQMKNTGEELEVYPIPETEFVIIEK
jgi:peptidase E